MGDEKCVCVCVCVYVCVVCVCVCVCVCAVVGFDLGDGADGAAELKHPARRDLRPVAQPPLLLIIFLKNKK